MCVSSFFHSLCSRLPGRRFFLHHLWLVRPHARQRGPWRPGGGEGRRPAHLASALGSVGPAQGAGCGGRLTFRRLGRSWEDSRSAGSGSRPGCCGRSQPRSSCGCPARTRPGLWGTEGGGWVYGGPGGLGLGAAGPVGAQLTRPHLVHSRQQSGPGASVGLASGRKARGRQSEQKQVSSLKSLQEPKSLQRLSLEMPLWVPPLGRHGLGFQNETTL